MLLKYCFRKFIEVVQQVKLFVVIILTICFISPLNVFGQQYATMPKCRQDSALREINLPILEIWTVGGVEPTATNVEAPPGMWGTSIIDNEYVYGRMIISLKDSEGNPLSNISVSVDLGGVKDYTTDEKGQINVSVQKLIPKTYVAKIKFLEKPSSSKHSVSGIVL